MTVRPEEAAYWDLQAANLCDNIWKRQWIARHLLELPLIGKRILEIGVGPGNTFGAINTIFLGNIKYMGTDVSPKYCEFAKSAWGLTVKNADIREIPADDDAFDYVVALDSLEHVRPEDRPQGYREIDRVLRKDKGKIVINMPLTVSEHDQQFDHGFNERDFLDLLTRLNMQCEEFRRYRMKTSDGTILIYGWGVGSRRR